MFWLLFFWFGCAWYMGWFLSATRECVRGRFRGVLAEHAHQYTSRLLQVAGLQIMLAV